MSGPQPSAPGPLSVYYGGTFDPVHNGHLAIARAARDALGTCIRLMPAADPPHRARPGADAEQRAAMLELAIADDTGLQVDRRELRRTGRSWSIDTVHELRAELGDEAPIALLVGADSFIDLPDWKQWRELLQLVHFVVAERPGNALDKDLPPALAGAVAGRWAQAPQALFAGPGGSILYLHQPLQPHSATDLRRRIADGRPWRQLVPDAVADYIVGEQLYLGAPSILPTFPPIIGP